jgi:hypothetical protein
MAVTWGMPAVGGGGGCGGGGGDCRGVTVNTVGLLAVPNAVCTTTTPVVAAAGTVASRGANNPVGGPGSTPNPVTAPLKLTEPAALAKLKLVPWMITAVPGGPLDGVMAVIVGMSGGGGGPPSTSGRGRQQKTHGVKRREPRWHGCSRRDTLRTWT